jgi:hypothetical protein
MVMTVVALALASPAKALAQTSPPIIAEPESVDPASLTGTWEGAVASAAGTGKMVLSIDSIDASSGVVRGVHRLERPAEASQEHQIDSGRLSGVQLTYKAGDVAYAFTLTGADTLVGSDSVTSGQEKIHLKKKPKEKRPCSGGLLVRGVGC